MSLDWISPFKFGKTEIIECSFKCNVEPDDVSDIRSEGISIGINTSPNLASNPDDPSEWACHIFMAVKVKTFSEEFGPDEKTNDSPWVYDIGIKAIGSTVVSCENDDPEELEQMKQALEANAISNVYSRLRFYVEELTSSSRYGMFSLPAIMPYEFMAANKEAEQDSEG